MTAIDVETAEHCDDDDDGPRVGPWPRSLRPDDSDALLLGRSVAAWRELTRRELGLAGMGPAGMGGDGDFPLIGSGHQATFWHPGIAMKLVAADEMAQRTGATLWHLVVDSDAHPIGETAVPVRRPDGALHEQTIEIGRDTSPSPEIPAGRRPPLTISPSTTAVPAALASVADGIAAVRAALRSASDAPDAAMQVTRAMIALLAESLHDTPPSSIGLSIGLSIGTPIVRSSSLLDTTLGRMLMERMRDDPRRCAESYNRAVESVHGAGSPLAVGDRVELPLWRLDDHDHRRRAFADELFDAPETGVTLPRALPRALLVTAIVRLAAADLFIHGTGGMAYDTAMERWLADWLGATVAPACLVTATLRLPLPERDIPADAVARAIAARRRRWWDPQDFVPAHPTADHPQPIMRAKQTLVDAIAAAPRNSPQRAELYRDLHRLLGELRHRAKPALDDADHAIENVRRQATGRPVAMSRTWPFPFHAPEAIHDLATRTRAAVAEAQT